MHIRVQHFEFVRHVLLHFINHYLHRVFSLHKIRELILRLEANFAPNMSECKILTLNQFNLALHSQFSEAMRGRELVEDACFNVGRNDSIKLVDEGLHDDNVS